MSQQTFTVGPNSGLPLAICKIVDNGNGSATITCVGGMSITLRNGTRCTVVDKSPGVHALSCDDGTSVTILDGKDGKNGLDGKSCTVIDNGNGTKTIACTDGTSAVVHDGKDGKSCTVIDNSNGTKTIACGDGTSVVVSDGKNGADGKTGADGKSALIQTRPEPAGSSCPLGGVAVLIGIDANSNGVLDATEVGQTSYVCDGLQGAAGAAGKNGADGKNGLVQTQIEPPGPNCPAGGTVVRSGVDANGNGVLEPAEATLTSYVCQGAQGVAGAPGKDGTSCTVKDNGDGTKTISCTDGTSVTVTNGAPGKDGTNGTNGLNSLTRLDDEPASSNCKNGGVAIKTGLDFNANGVLEDGEVTQTKYICNSTAAQAVCGNGIREGAEQCDGADLGWENCQSLGLQSGPLGCRADCTFDITGCAACYTGTTKPCYEGDAAQVGVGVCVAGTRTCVSAAWSSCIGVVYPSQEKCDGLDNDCDGIIDNGFNLQQDVKNCGACGNACTSPAHSISSCSNGVCGSTCTPGYGDCNGAAQDGCEVALTTDPNNCGSCGNSCTSGACDGGKCKELFLHVSAGYAHTCGVKLDGTIACWGDAWAYNSQGQSSPPAGPPAGTFVQVSAGKDFTCGLQPSGAIICWGWRQMSPPVGTFTQVSARVDHACGLRTDGTIACWGNNDNGECSPPAGTFTQVSVGDNHICGVGTNGSVSCWGMWFSSSPLMPPPPNSGFLQVSSGYMHTCSTRTTGVSCWGVSFGYPRTVPLVTVAVGAMHSCGIRGDKNIVCWGYNDDGQLLSPAGTFNQLSGGDYHTCALRTDKAVVCWGRNDHGQSAAP